MPCSTWASPATPPRGCWPGWNPSWAPGRLGDQTIVVVAVGFNETSFDLRTGRAAHDPERFAATLAELVAMARRHTDRVLLVGDHAALLHDGLHPNGAGHQLLADRIGERLAPWL